MRKVVILGSGRTTGGKYDGSLKSLAAPEIGGQVVKETIRRSGITPDVIDQTIFGSAWQAGVGPNPARLTAVAGGFPRILSGFGHVRCGSSIQALIMGCQAIKAEDVIQSWWVVPKAPTMFYGLPKARWGYRWGGEIEDLLHKDGFLCPVAGGFMGELTDVYATNWV
jgi:acetyl-CoA C-acetyltransferase